MLKIAMEKDVTKIFMTFPLWKSDDFVRVHYTVLTKKRERFLSAFSFAQTTETILNVRRVWIVGQATLLFRSKNRKRFCGNLNAFVRFIHSDAFHSSCSRVENKEVRAKH